VGAARTALCVPRSDGAPVRRAGFSVAGASDRTRSALAKDKFTPLSIRIVFKAWALTLSTLS
jgi:hypothetical protein